MAVSVAVPVGKTTADRLMKKLIPRVENLKIGPSIDPTADFGPLVTRAALDRVKNWRKPSLVTAALKSQRNAKALSRQYRSGFAVHQLRLHQHIERGWHPHLDGRLWLLDGQRLH